MGKVLCMHPRSKRIQVGQHTRCRQCGTDICCKRR